MKKIKWPLFLTVFLTLGFLVNVLVFAQGATVPYQTSKFTWDAPPTDEQVTLHTLKCGTVAGTWLHTFDINMPSLEAQVSDVVPTGGQWVCVATATNVAGEGGESLQVPFVAVDLPGAPAGFVVLPN